MSNKEVSQENKELANYITTIVGINRSVHRYWDDDRKQYIDIFSCDDPTNSEVKFYGTIGLSDYPNEIEMSDESVKNIPIEFLITGYKKFDEVPNIIATCAFFLMKNDWPCQPGSVYKNMVEMYYKGIDMKHIFFIPPFLWEDKLKPLTLETKTVHWLLGIPISDSELNYRNENGASALEQLFEQKEIDIFDIDRKSVV